MMSKTRFFWIILLLTMAFIGCSRTPQNNKDFFTGKWEISVAETPEVRFVTDLTRQNGQLTGELADAVDSTKPKLPITKVEEKGNSVSIYYHSAQNKEMAIDLTKVDQDNLKGTMYTFDASAKRLK